MMKTLIGLSLVLSAQALASDCTEATFQKRGLEPILVNSADIGVPTSPPVSYQERTLSVIYHPSDRALSPFSGTIQMVQIGNIVTLTVKAAYFRAGFSLCNNVSATIDIPRPREAVQTTFTPIADSSYSDRYPGLCLLSDNFVITLFYVPDPTSTWPYGRYCTWDDFSVTYFVD